MHGAALVDPSPGSTPWVQENGRPIDKILITHSHWDHITDAHIAKKIFGAPVYIHEEDAANLRDPGADHLPMLLQVKPEGVEPDYLIKDGDRIEVGKLLLEVIHTPGHSPGSVCFHCAEKKFLIGGDLIFKGGIGNLSLPTAQPERMWKSLERIMELPPETLIFPGHGEPTILSEEPWLKDAKKLFS